MFTFVDLRTLKQGDQGHQVVVLQLLLSAVGHEIRQEVTGVFDNDTRLNLMKIQRIKGLEPAIMGQCDPVSWAFLLKGE